MGGDCIDESHIFISYAREDQSFVRRLHEALEEREIETWVDWEGIAPSAEWMAEIRRAIAAADAFVFVLSPDSVESSVCREELDQAAGSNKRIIPVVARAVDGSAVPDVARAINWVDFCPDFGGALDQLQSAIETDLDWVRLHTQLLVRALEWQDRHRDRSRLLRGRQLAEAERWLSETGDKEPAPTPVHTEYVIGSRRGATRRQRILIVSITAGLVITILLAVFAELQRREAEHRRQIADSRRLAAVALTVIDQQPDLAILLALESEREVSTNESASSLLAALSRQPELVTYLRGHTDAVNGLAITPDGSRLFSGSTDGTIRDWDLTAPGEVAVLATLEQPPGDIALSPDGSMLAAAGFRGVTILDTASGEVLRRFETDQPDLLFAVAFSSDGATVAAGGDRERPYVWNLETGDEIALLSDGEGGPIETVAFDSTGTRLATGGPESLSMWNLEVGAEMWQMPPTVPSPVFFVLDVSFTSDGEFVFAAGSLNSVVTVEEPEIVFEPDFVTSRVAVAGAVAFAGSGEGLVRRVEVESGIEVGRPLFGHLSGVSALASTPDGATVASGDFDGTIMLWDLAQGGAAIQWSIDRPGSAVAYNPDGAVLFSATLNGEILEIDVGSGEVRASWQDHTETVSALATTSDGARVASGGFGLDVMVHDRATDRVVVGSGHVERVTSLAIPPDDAQVVSVSNEGEVLGWDIDSGETTPRSRTVDLPGVALDSAIAASGRVVAWPMAEGFVTVWDEESAAVESLTHPRSITAMYSAAINPAESIVAAGNGRGFIFLWDLATGEPIGEPIAAGDERLVSLAFSPNGEMLASGDAVGVTRLWDVATGVAVGNPLIRSSDVLLDVTFSPDGTLLVASGFGDITAWRIGLGESLSSGCAVAARNLTQAEWTQYIGDGFSYAVTCPEYGPPRNEAIRVP